LTTLAVSAPSFAPAVPLALAQAKPLPAPFYRARLLAAAAETLPAVFHRAGLLGSARGNRRFSAGVARGGPQNASGSCQRNQQSSDREHLLHFRNPPSSLLVLSMAAFPDAAFMGPLCKRRAIGNSWNNSMLENGESANPAIR
jgi:hypothetical protein